MTTQIQRFGILNLTLVTIPNEWVMGYAAGWAEDRPKPKDFQPGPIHPKQYLIANFGFEKGEFDRLCRQRPSGR